MLHPILWTRALTALGRGTTILAVRAGQRSSNRRAVRSSKMCYRSMTSAAKYFQVGLTAPAVVRCGTMEQGGQRT